MLNSDYIINPVRMGYIMECIIGLIGISWKYHGTYKVVPPFEISQLVNITLISLGLMKVDISRLIEWGYKPSHSY